tara:strand:- start:1803 stop:2006 length:204 start_codon:yes stop_codon:yes gene_type:complete
MDKCKEMLGAQLNTIHNLHYYQSLMADLRSAVEQGKLAAFREGFYAAQAKQQSLNATDNTTKNITNE